MLSASDLADGSESVLVDGSPTALEDKSSVSTSNGDQAGTQGGNVVTHKTQGKGYFMMWSFTLVIEGKGAARHGDPMGQNSASSPPGCVDNKALVSYAVSVDIGECTEKYDREGLELDSVTPEQKEAVRGGPCWECTRDMPAGDWNSVTLANNKVVSKASAYVSGWNDDKHFTPDHQPPLCIAWYLGGCKDPEAFKTWANSVGAVKPHCADHSNSQRNVVGGIVRGGPAKAFAKILARL
jgi:uncharacterized Zn-binding protein involved in type VI secretion